MKTLTHLGHSPIPSPPNLRMGISAPGPDKGRRPRPSAFLVAELLLPLLRDARRDTARGCFCTKLLGPLRDKPDCMDDWWRSSVFSLLMPFVRPLVSILLLVTLGPVIFNTLMAFIRQQLGTIRARPMQAHCHHLKMNDLGGSFATNRLPCELNWTVNAR